MSENLASVWVEPSVEDVLRSELSHGDAMIGSISPILRHLLASDDHSLFSDEIIARVRGMLDHLARQLLDSLNVAGEPAETVVARLIEDPALLAHVHALAIEFQLTERLHARLTLDPVLSPLLQALIASPDSAVAGSGMALLAAQARFVQAQRRMQLSLTELPADLFHAALQALRAIKADAVMSAAAEADLRSRFDEGRSRLGLMSRLVVGMGGGASAALTVAHAGVGLFLTALALGSSQDRDLAVLSTNEAQMVRLALALRAAGMRPEAVAEQFQVLHPQINLPDGFDQLGADRAAALLARSLTVSGR